MTDGAQEKYLHSCPAGKFGNVFFLAEARLAEINSSGAGRGKPSVAAFPVRAFRFTPPGTIYGKLFARGPARQVKLVAPPSRAMRGLATRNEALGSRETTMLGDATIIYKSFWSGSGCVCFRLISLFGQIFLPLVFPGPRFANQKWSWLLNPH